MKNITRILVTLCLLLAISAVAYADEAPQLNVSHIQCVGAAVEVHFVLVHSETSDGAPVLFTLNGQPQVAYWQKFVGGVNHYTDLFTQTVPTTYTITAASLVYDDEVLPAHNLPFEVDALDCHPTAITLEAFTAQAGTFPNMDAIAWLLIATAGFAIGYGVALYRRWTLTKEMRRRERMK